MTEYFDKKAVPVFVYTAVLRVVKHNKTYMFSLLMLYQEFLFSYSCIITG